MVTKKEKWIEHNRNNAKWLRLHYYTVVQNAHIPQY